MTDFLEAYDDPSKSTLTGRVGNLEAWLTNAPVPLPETQGKAVQAADAMRFRETDQVLTQPTEQGIARLTDLANAKGTPEGPEATVGMAHELAAQTGEQLPAPLSSSAAWRERTRIMQNDLHTLIGQAEGAALDENEVHPTGIKMLDAALSTLKRVDREAGDFAVGVFVPQDQENFYSIAKKWMPDLSMTDRFNKAAVGSELRSKLNKLYAEDPAAGLAAAKELVQAAADVSVDYRSPGAAKARLVKAVLGSVLEDVGSFDHIASALTYLGPIDAAVGVAGAGLKVATGAVNLASDVVRAGQAGTAGLAAAAGRMGAVGARSIVPPATVAATAATPVARAAELGKSAIEEQTVLRGAEVYEPQTTTIPTRAAVLGRIKEIRTQLDTLPRSVRADEGLGAQRSGLTQELTDLQQLSNDLKTGVKVPGTTRVFAVGSGRTERVFVAGPPVPTIIPGGVADAATMTRAGASTAVEAAKSGDTAALAARGTTQEEVVGSFTIPKFDDLRNELGRPDVDPQLWSADALRSMKERVTAGLGNVLSTRLKDTVFTRIGDDGIEYLARYGKADGRGFTTQAEAVAHANSTIGAEASVVREGDEWFVQAKGMALPTMSDIKSELDWVKRGAVFTRFFGAESSFTTAFNKLAAAAQRRTNEALQVADKTLAKLYALPRWQRGKVYALIDAGDRNRKVYTAAEAMAELGDEKAVRGYQSFLAMARKSHGMLDGNIRNWMIDNGYVYGATSAGKVPMRAIEGTRTQEWVTLNGQATTRAKEAGDTVYELLTPVNGHNYLIVRKGERLATTPPPQQVLNVVPGYVFRQNSFSHYVIDDMGRALVGARSEVEAAGEVAKRAAAGEAVTYRAATETQGITSTEGVVQNLKSQGLFSHQTPRSQNILQGVDGVERITSIEDGIRMMVRQYGSNAGLGKLSDILVAQANLAVKDIPGVTFALGRRAVPSTTLTAEQAAAVARGTRLIERAESINGVAPAWLGHFVESMRVPVSDVLLNGASAIRNDVKGLGAAGLPYKGMAAAAEKLGLSLAGVDNSLLSAARGVAFYGLLGTNVLRNWITQTALFPHYVALQGGTRYLMGGRYFADAAGLSISLMKGSAVPGMEKFLKLWEATGVGVGVKGHPAVLGMLDTGAGRAGSSGLLKYASEGTLNAVRKVGFDGPVTADKINAFLFSVKRWQSQTGKAWPKTEAEINEITYWTEKNSLQQTQVGALMTERGVLGVATQFLGYTMKMSGRLMGLEKGYSASERLRMAAYTVGTFGLPDDLVDYAESKSGSKWDPRVKKAVQQGIAGSLLNAAFSALGDDGKHNDDFFDVSGSISPTNFLNNSFVPAITHLLNGQIEMPSMASWLAESPIVGVMDNVGQLLSFGKFLVSEVDADWSAKGEAMALQAMRTFPITNNILRAHIAHTRGVMVDRQGQPVVEANEQAWVASLFGLRTYGEKEVRELKQASWKDYSNEDTDGEAFLEGVKDYAKENARKLKTIIDAAGTDGSIDVQGLIESHSQMVQKNFSEAERMHYRQALTRELKKLDVLGSEKAVTNLMRAIKAGDFASTQSNLDRLATLNAPGVEHARSFMQSQMDMSAFVKNYLESKE